jgi:hypothetical protein
VAKLVASVDDFENSYLPIAATGRTALYQRLNGLIAAYGLVNTTGPEYSPLETTDQGRENQTEQDRGRSKFRSLFPGVYVTTTLEGSYQNLRRFIREIETGNDFVIISAVELEPSDSARPANQAAPGTEVQDPNDLASVDVRTGQLQPVGAAQQQQQPQYRRPSGKTRGETVSLRLEMAANFRRSNPAPLDNGVEAQ